MEMLLRLAFALLALAAAGVWFMGLLAFLKMLGERREGTSAFQLATMWLTAGEESLTERGLEAKRRMLRFVGLFVLLIVVAAALGILGGAFASGK